MYAEIEMPQNWIWAELRDGDTPSMAMFVKTQYDVASCVNAVYFVDISIIKVHHLLLFDGASDMVNEENEKTRPTPISVALRIPRKSSHTFLAPDPHTRREGIQGSSP